MAIKYFCDGCDEHLNVGHFQERYVKVNNVSGGTIVLDSSFHLCNGCARQLDEKSNPRKWVRCKEAPKSAA